MCAGGRDVESGGKGVRNVNPTSKGLGWCVRAVQRCQFNILCVSSPPFLGPTNPSIYCCICIPRVLTAVLGALWLQSSVWLSVCCLMVSAQHLPLQISQCVCPHIHSGPSLGVKGTCVRTMKEHKCDLYAMRSSLAVAQHGFSPKPDTHFSSTDGQQMQKVVRLTVQASWTKSSQWKKYLYCESLMGPIVPAQLIPKSDINKNGRGFQIP